MTIEVFVTPLFLALLALFGLVVAVTAIRDHKRVRAARFALLDHAAAALEQPALSHGGDGFPKLRGSSRGFKVHVDLIPDTLVVRRLPQLWMSVTLLAPNAALPAFGALVRYSGNEFYALTPEFPHRLEPPKRFPHEVMVRGEWGRAQDLLDLLGQPLSELLADPLVKEVAVTPKGLRIVRQAAEGRRGEHLLLRQASFDTTSVPVDDLQMMLAALSALQSAVSLLTGAKAA